MEAGPAPAARRRLAPWNPSLKRTQKLAVVFPSPTHIFVPFSISEKSASSGSNWGETVHLGVLLHLGSGREEPGEEESSECKLSRPPRPALGSHGTPLAVLITNHVPDRCWRPSLRSSCPGLEVTHFPFIFASRLSHPAAGPPHKLPHLGQLTCMPIPWDYLVPKQAGLMELAKHPPCE